MKTFQLKYIFEHLSYRIVVYCDYDHEDSCLDIINKAD